MNNFGIVQYFNGSDGDDRHCGYCNQTTEKATYGMWAYALTCQSYQDLIDRNWRRSGQYCYRPINDKICCPMYTIRCHAENFCLRKSHRKIIKNFNNFIKFDIKSSRSSKVHVEENISQTHTTEVISNEHNDSIENSSKDKASNEIKQNSSTFQGTIISNEKNELKNETENDKKSTRTNEQKKKYKRRLKLIEKIMKRTNCSEDGAKQYLAEKAKKRNKTKTLEDLIEDYKNCGKSKHKFRHELHLVSENPTYQEYCHEYNVYKKYQIAIHKDKENELSFNSFCNFLLKTPLKEKQFPDYALFMGSYHQRYYIDDKLIAVGVIDILPSCISSVYFFYDPDYSFLNLGTYSALNELETVRRLHKNILTLRYYYLGFYIHSCPKMRYKAQYRPADLLCSETFKWIPIDECLSKLQNGQKYARFSSENAIDDNEKTPDEVLVFHDGIAFYSTLRNRLLLSEKEKFEQFKRLIGKKALRETLYLFT